MKEYGIKYVPSKCIHYCCGECVIDMQNCLVTFDECSKKEKLDKLTKLSQELGLYDESEE